MATMGIRLGGPKSEFSESFVQGMADRMATSYHKYGPLSDNYPFPGDALASMRERLKRYEESGNTEWLMDVANFAMIEFMRPGHPTAHFKSTSSHESPGVRVQGGRSVHDNISDHKDE